MVKTEIEHIINDYLEGKHIFLVEVQVKKGNVINVFIDGDKGVKIDECVKISRLIESTFDREVEDYELLVSSPGAERPFAMKRQYNKYLDREIMVTTKDEIKREVKLKSISQEGIELEIIIGKKGQEIRIEHILFSDIREAKPVINFKTN